MSLKKEYKVANFNSQIMSIDIFIIKSARLWFSNTASKWNYTATIVKPLLKVYG
jgi:cobyric acid synthase